MTPEQLKALTDRVDANLAAERGAAQPQAARGMTPQELKALTDQVDAGTDQPAALQASQPQAAPAAPPPADDYSQYAGTPYNPTAEEVAALDNSTTGQLIRSVGGGAAKAIWETKDFFAGEPEESDKSSLRKQIEAENKKLAEASGWNSLAMGVSQFAVGILGAGKVTKALGAGKWVGSLGKSVLDGALAGAVAFDPHEERFSDLVDRFAPNIVTGYLKSNPNDAAWEGRLKNSLESIGLDAAMVGVLALGGKVLRARKAGDALAAGKAEEELAAATKKLEETQQGAPKPADDTGTLPRGDGATGETPRPGEASTQAADTGAPKSEAVTLEVVDSPTQAGAPRRDAGSPMASVSDVDLAMIARGADRDFKALAAHGSWENAIAAGHTFGKGGSIPWQTLSKGAEPSTAVDAVIAPSSAPGSSPQKLAMWPARRPRRALP